METTQGSPKYWMSLDQWRQDPEFLAMAEKEFLSSPLQTEDNSDGVARRDFLRLMGASLALTTFGCVRRPAQKIIPYVNKPETIVHGLSNHYASSMTVGMDTLGILVTTRDGRPIKIEGNPLHSANLGGMSARAHASILKLYDPDRYTGPKHNLQNEKRTNREIINVAWEKLDEAVVEQLNKGKVAVLSDSHTSPTRQVLMDDFASAYSAKVYHYDDVDYDGVWEAQALSFGQGGLPRYQLDKAKYILSVNNDFLGTWLNQTSLTRQFGKSRKADKDMNKLVVFESLMSLTGMNADQRYRIRPTQSLDVLLALLQELVVTRKVSRFANDTAVLKALSGAGKLPAELQAEISKVAGELLKNKGQSVVLAGGMAAGTENSVALQVAANFLNVVLENDGKTFVPVGVTQATAKGAESVNTLIAAMNAKQVSTLVIHGSNPLYTLPESSGFKKAMANVEMVIYTGDRNDETARLVDFVATDNHPLESWGDMVSLDGMHSIQQPTIRPLYETRAFEDTLLSWLKVGKKGSARAKASDTYYDYLKSNWKDTLLTGGNFEDQWNNLLQKGVHAGREGGSGARAFSTAALSVLKSEARNTGFEVALYEKVGIGDGKLANVSWLQELPDPVTKLVWDNYACFSPKDASQLKVKEGQHVSLTVGEQKVEVPAHIQPGQADGVIGLAVGYGRNGGGKVADGVGVNAFALAGWSKRRITAGLETNVVVLPKKVDLACTMGHHSMEGRQIVVEETLEDHLKTPGGNVHRHKMTTMWSEHKYNGNKWTMTIDLNTCTGCSACVIACQSENNIPTVGKKYVLEGREMHWIRIDRYYVGTPENPDTVFQPLPCMHCDNAPCETVCPVIATVHSDEGTNDMIYNRCVGTRYCSNNCPYKVRRFNWFNYTNEIPDPLKKALNPDVTVRFRGVMEKCTFCIHRIRSTKSQAKLQDRPLGPNEVKTACQQSCPTGAITFGDFNNKESDVSKLFEAPSTYALLEELNTKPAVRYHVKVRNNDSLKGEKKKHHGEGHHA